MASLGVRMKLPDKLVELFIVIKCYTAVQTGPFPPLLMPLSSAEATSSSNIVSSCGFAFAAMNDSSA